MCALIKILCQVRIPTNHRMAMGNFIKEKVCNKLPFTQNRFYFNLNVLEISLASSFDGKHQITWKNQAIYRWSLQKTRVNSMVRNTLVSLSNNLLFPQIKMSVGT